MRYQYSVKQLKENMAKAVGISMPISLKHSVEICNVIRGKNIEEAKKMLDDVIQLKKPVPLRRFNSDVGHKRGTAAGRFPKKAATEIRKILESAQKNAQFKGLSTANLKITHLSTKQAEGAWHYGRHFRRNMKRATVEVILEETAKEEKKKEVKKK